MTIYCVLKKIVVGSFFTFCITAACMGADKSGIKKQYYGVRVGDCVQGTLFPDNKLVIMKLVKVGESDPLFTPKKTNKDDEKKTTQKNTGKESLISKNRYEILASKHAAPVSQNIYSTSVKKSLAGKSHYEKTLISCNIVLQDISGKRYKGKLFSCTDNNRAKNHITLTAGCISNINLERA